MVSGSLLQITNFQIVIYNDFLFFKNIIYQMYILRNLNKTLFFYGVRITDTLILKWNIVFHMYTQGRHHKESWKVYEVF